MLGVWAIEIALQWVIASNESSCLAKGHLAMCCCISVYVEIISNCEILLTCLLTNCLLVTNPQPLKNQKEWWTTVSIKFACDCALVDAWTVKLWSLPVVVHWLTHKRLQRKQRGSGNYSFKKKKWQRHCQSWMSKFLHVCTLDLVWYWVLSFPCDSLIFL